MGNKRKAVVSKDKFLSVFVPEMKKAGVCFVSGGRTAKGKEKYWELFSLVLKTLVAAAAASGTSVSLAGLGVGNFVEAGRGEKRCPRFKFKLSSALQKMFIENQELVRTSEDEPTQEEFERAFVEVLSVLGVKESPVTFLDASDSATQSDEGDVDPDDDYAAAMF